MTHSTSLAFSSSGSHGSSHHDTESSGNGCSQEHSLDPELSSSTHATVLSYILFSNSTSLYLAGYDNSGVGWTRFRSQAKSFYSLASAEAAGKILHCSVAPGALTGSGPTAEPRPASAISKQHKNAHLYEEIVHLGGAVYAGIFEGGRDWTGKPTDPLVLFSSKKTGTTLGIVVAQLSSRAVRREVSKSDKQFDVFSERATERVFKQFADKQQPLVLEEAVCA
jgi:hypothetical protein